VLVHPGASAASRRYPAAAFGAAAALLNREGLDAQLVFCAGPGESDLLDEAAAALGGAGHVLAPLRQLGLLAALVAGARLLVGNNSGPVHLAAALGTPVVDLYALTNPQHTPWQVPARVLSHDVPCRNCLQSVCAQGHHDCPRRSAWASGRARRRGRPTAGPRAGAGAAARRPGRGLRRQRGRRARMSPFIEGPVRRILVLRALMLGDTLCAVPALRAIRRAWPQARIALLGLPASRELAARLPYVDEWLAFPGWPGLPEQPVDVPALPDFIAAMQAARWDLAIQLHGSGQLTNPLVAAFGARQVAGFHAEGGFVPDARLFCHWPERGHEVQRLLALCRHLGLPVDDGALEFPLRPGDDAALRAAWPGWDDSAPYACVLPARSSRRGAGRSRVSPQSPRRCTTWATRWCSPARRPNARWGRSCPACSPHAACRM
jgi:ADP-heptose:LPS heptosyltransferase